MQLSTRRDFIKHLAFLGLVSFSTTPLHAKATKNVTEYQDTPKNGEKCKECIHFLSKTNECKVVQGNISPDGWCKLYVNLNK